MTGRAGTPGYGTLGPNSRAGTPGLAGTLRAAGELPGRNGAATMRAGPPEAILQSVSFGEGLSAEAFDAALIHSPRTPVHVGNAAMLRPRNLEQKAALNRGWLDSSRSLMEQGIFEGDLVQLRYKFTNYFDLNPKYDPVRINQLYEQAKWAILMEELDCTDEEAAMFAALQLQALAGGDRSEKDEIDEDRVDGAPKSKDDVDDLLSELESQLTGGFGVPSATGHDLMSVPELGEYLRYFKPKKLTLKGWKRAFFTFRDLYLSWYPSASEAAGPPLGRFCLKGAEVTPDVNIGQNKYCIKLLVPSAEGMTEFYLKCDSDQQYAR